MAQYIKQGDIFGRIGSGVGKGLAEQLPKEIENSRLRSGLQSLADESDKGNLSPAQFLAKASGTYGATPQMIQSFGELAKIQNQGNAYKKTGMPGGRSSADLSDVKMQNMIDQQLDAGSPMINGQNPKSKLPGFNPTLNNQRTPNLGRTEDIPQVAPGNPLNQENLTKLPWTPQKRNAVTSDYIQQGFLPPQAEKLAADDEERELSQPGVHRERQETIKAGKEAARASLIRHIETKFQKSGEGIYKDVEGPMLINAERGMIRDLILNPNKDIDNVANDWSDRLYRTALAKNDLRKLGKTTGVENFFKKNQSVQKLNDFQDIFKKSGNLEEFNNMLKSELGMSPQAAASVAYPINKNMNEFISKIPRSSNPTGSEDKAEKIAEQISSIGLNSDDSILSIARNISEKDPYFDQQTFLNYLSENKDRLNLNDRQRLELAEGARGFTHNWADLLYLPVKR